jgi:hypothetical protein
MNLSWKFARCIIVVLFAALAVQAQEKSGASEEAKSLTSLKVQIVLAEYDGAKKIASLPYVLALAPRGPVTPTGYITNMNGSTRTGVRVPVSLETKDSKYEYIDVGTNLDCNAQQMTEGRYGLRVILERSSVYSQVGQNKAVEWAPGEERPSYLPLVRSFRTQFELLLRDGQTVEGATATDPLTGHVLKTEVTLNVVK